MRWVHRLAAVAGFAPVAQVEARVRSAALRAAFAVAEHASTQQRNLLSALTTPDVASWQTDGAHLNAIGTSNLAVARARSRDGARNNEYARRFLGMLRSNVLGPLGMRYQSRLIRPDGEARKSENDALEAAWASFGRAGACDVTGRYTMAMLERVALRMCAVDGECFVRLRVGVGPHAIQLQLLPADVVPLQHSADLGGGVRIRQGVEFNADGKVLAYHMRSDDATLDVAAALGASAGQRVTRVAAEEVLHLFLPEEVGQLRGVPWMQAALKRMHQAADFASAGLNKAREAAKRGGFIQPDKDADPRPGVPPASTDIAAGAAAEAVAAMPSYASLHDGTWERLAPGEVAQPFESDYPNIEYGQFIKDCARGISMALDVAYFTLGNDLADVNYSAGQLGLEGERAMWLTLQDWWAHSAFSQRVHDAWLKSALVAAPELRSLSFARLAEYRAAARWQGHRWRPIDPLKSTEADRSRIEAFLTSPQRVIAAGGEDPEEVLAELLEWAAKTKSLRADLAAVQPARAPGSVAGAEPSAEPAADTRAARRLALVNAAAD